MKLKTKGKFKRATHAVVIKDANCTIVKFGTIQEICDAFGVDRPLIDSSVPAIIEDFYKVEGHQVKARFEKVHKAVELSRRLSDARRSVHVL